MERKVRGATGQLQVFKNEIVDLAFHNVLRSFILVCITDYVDTGISRKHMLRVSESLKQSYDLFKFIDDELKSSFEVFYERNFEQTVQDIIDGLITAKILRRKPGTLNMIVGKMSLDRLKKSIVQSLNTTMAPKQNPRFVPKLNTNILACNCYPD